MSTEAGTTASDAAAREAGSRLSPELRVLADALPRSRWGELAGDGLARTWLGMHASLRQGQQQLDTLARRWQLRQIDWMGLRRELPARIDGHLGHLHGHHDLEDRHYFPAIRRADPRLARGIDLLDGDHRRIHELLQAIVVRQQRLRVASPAEASAFACAHELADHALRLSPLLLQHLHDEEDLVIPVLARQEQREKA